VFFSFVCYDVSQQIGRGYISRRRVSATKTGLKSCFFVIVSLYVFPTCIIFNILVNFNLLFEDMI